MVKEDEPSESLGEGWCCWDLLGSRKGDRRAQIADASQRRK